MVLKYIGVPGAFLNDQSSLNTKSVFTCSPSLHLQLSFLKPIGFSFIHLKPTYSIILHRYHQSRCVSPPSLPQRLPPILSLFWPHQWLRQPPLSKSDSCRACESHKIPGLSNSELTMDAGPACSADSWTSRSSAPSSPTLVLFWTPPRSTASLEKSSLSPPTS